MKQHHAELSMGKRRIGPHEPALIIAEAGVNHDGSLEKALKLVDVAWESGADAVKFQVFDAAALVTRSAQAAAYQAESCGATTQFEMLAELELRAEALGHIKDRCSSRGIELIVTPFGLESLALVLPLGCAAIKIASTDLTNTQLITQAAQSGLPLILSTGAAQEDEIRACLRHARQATGGAMAVLHCVSCYPTPVEAMNLNAIATLHDRFQVPTGLSDHTQSTQMGGWAVAAGARLIEKHITLDANSPGPDHGFSMEPAPFQAYVANIREAGAAMGDGALGMAPIEIDVRNASRRSVVAAVAIHQGACLRAEMLTFKRPGTGIEPSRLDELVGRAAATDIPRDTVLSWAMVR